MKQILYLSYDGMTDPLGQSQVLPYLKGLSELGYRFTLISFEKPERFDDLKAHISQLCEASNIDWIPLQYTKRPPVLSTVFDVRKMRKKALQVVAEKNIALVHCRSYIAMLTGMYLKRKARIPLLFDMRGFWADERVDGKIWSLDSPIYSRIYRYFKRKETQYLATSDAIISLTEAGKNLLSSSKFGSIPSEKITVIPCCADLEKFNANQFSSEQKKELRSSLGLSNELVIGYVGSIGTWYMLPEMLATFKGIKTNFPTAKFLFVTADAPAHILNQADQLGLSPEDFIIRKAAHHEVPAYISLMDWSIFYILPTFSKMASSPTKQGELMAMNVPLICNDFVGDTGKIVRDYQAGLVIDIAKNEHLSVQLSAFDSSKSKAIQGANDIYSLKGGVLKYNEVYKKCLEKTEKN